MKQLSFFIVFLTLSTMLFAQSNKTISGKITDDAGEAMPGVTIKESEASNGTISSIDGTYSIVLKNDNAALEFSFIGFETVVEETAGRAHINVQMKASASDLDELVVIGYGEVRKRDLTGAVSTVKVQDDIARQYQSVDMMLKGRSAGVQVTGNAGAPGSAVSVRIRGANSLRGNNEPLYVVDGVIITTAGEEMLDPSSDANELQAPQNGLTGLNPQDIESVEILKDASATAIYGSRGANGVVLITTKSGKNTTGDKANINVYGATEYTIISKKIDLLDGVGFAKYQNESDLLKGFDEKYHIENGQIYKRNDDGTPKDNPLDQVNWQDKIYRPSWSYNAGLSINGKSDKSNYYFSASFSDQQGIVETNNIKRGDLRFNYARDLSKKLKLDTRTSMMYQNGSFAQGGSKSGGNRSFSKQILTYRPISSEEPDDDLDLEVSNPDAWLTDFDDLSEEIRVNTSASLSYQIVKGLKYKISAGLDYRNKSRTKFYDTGVFVGQKENGLANYSYQTRYAYTFDNILNYTKQFNRRHRLTAMAGLTYDGISSKSLIYEVANFPIKNLRADAPQLGQSVYVPYTQLYDESEIFSVLGRANYTLMDKYIFTASVRGDQSSKFHGDNKWGYFPSAAFAWRAMEEDFIKNLNVFHNLKIRAGWGETGNQAIRSYQTLSTYSTLNYVSPENTSVVGNALAHIPNPDLKWETARQFNAGVDMAFWSGRLSATFDFYKKNTKDLLQEISLGPSNGFTKMYINRGEIENMGYELALDAVLLEKNDWSVSLGANASINHNEVKSLGLRPSTIWQNGTQSEEVFYLGNGVSTGFFKQAANIFMEGQPMAMFWGYQTAGIYQNDAEAAAGPKFNGNDNQAGDVIFVDQNEDGNINSDDNTFIGNPNPKLIYGFNLNVSYKDFYLSALFEGIYGADIINSNMMELAYSTGKSKNVIPEAYYNAWREGAESNLYPRVGYDRNEYLSDRVVEDGSYLRISNITLGYNIPTKRIKAISNARLYATGRNLFTITKYKGYDPQVSSFLYDGTIVGVDWTGSPNVKTFLLGFNLTF